MLFHSWRINPFVVNARFVYPLKTSGGERGGRESVHWEQIGNEVNALNML